MDMAIKKLYEAMKKEEEEGKKLFHYIYLKELVSSRENLEEVYKQGPHDLNALIFMKKEHELFSEIITAENNILKEHGIICQDYEETKPLGWDSIPKPTLNQEFHTYYNYFDKIAEICFDIFSELSCPCDIAHLMSHYCINGETIRVNYSTIEIAKKLALSKEQVLKNFRTKYMDNIINIITD